MLLLYNHVINQSIVYNGLEVDFLLVAVVYCRHMPIIVVTYHYCYDSTVLLYSLFMKTTLFISKFCCFAFASEVMPRQVKESYSCLLVFPFQELNLDCHYDFGCDLPRLGYTFVVATKG